MLCKLPTYCVNLYPHRVFTQSLHKMCNNWANLPTCCVTLPIYCVNLYLYRVFTQSFYTKYVKIGTFSELLDNFINDYVTTQHMGKSIHNMGIFTQSLHILCNDFVNT